MPKTRRPIDPRQQNQVCDLDFEQAPVASEFIRAVRNGPDSEIMCVGARGDSKTISALTAMTLHAEEHFKRGYPLPVPWIGVTDTFTSHKLKTIHSMELPLWKGGWRLSDGDHVATFMVGGQRLVRLDLFGIEDQGAKDRVRMETCGVWFEEPAPAALMVQTTGVDEDSWNIACTSRRIPSYLRPAIATLNYPDEDHWTWRRWKPSSNIIFAKPEKLRAIVDIAGIEIPEGLFEKYANGTPVAECNGGLGSGRRWFRIPVGERASLEQMTENARALSDNPGMFRRLILGQPGVIMLGQQVAQGFNLDLHVSKESIKPEPGQPLGFGFDFGHTPTCIIGQQVRGGVKVLAGLYLQNSGMRQLMEEQVLPWLGRFAPWVLRNPDEFALVGYDPSGDTTSDADENNSALKVIQEMLGGGNFEPGPVKWPNRRNTLAIFHRIGGMLMDPVWCADLIKACNGRWYYPKSHQGDLRSDLPKKPNHPWEDLGDALIYLLCRMGTVTWNEKKKPVGVETVFNVFQPNRDESYTVESDFIP